MNLIKTLPRQLLFICTLMSLVLTSCSSTRTIVNGIEEKEANEILVYLNNKGINSSKTPQATAGGGGRQTAVLYDITVPEDQANEAMALLNIAGLPRKRGQNLLNIFAGGGLVPSQMEEKIRFQQGLAEQIASTLRKIDGVIDADVLLTFPEEDPLNPEKTKGKLTAAVFIKHNGILDDPNANLVSKIKRLVASSIPNLDYDNVTVIGDRARNTTLVPESSTNASQEKMVNVWGLQISDASLHRFQVLFFTLSALMVLFLLALVWLIWKIFPVIKQAGGLRELLHINPFHMEGGVSTAKEAEKPEGEEEDKAEAPKQEAGMEPDLDAGKKTPPPEAKP